MGAATGAMALAIMLARTRPQTARAMLRSTANPPPHHSPPFFCRGRGALRHRHTVESCAHACEGAAYIALQAAEHSRALGGLCSCGPPTGKPPHLRGTSGPYGRVSDMECAWPCRPLDPKPDRRPCGGERRNAVYCTLGSGRCHGVQLLVGEAGGAAQGDAQHVARGHGTRAASMGALSALGALGAGLAALLLAAWRSRLQRVASVFAPTGAPAARGAAAPMAGASVTALPRRASAPSVTSGTPPRARALPATAVGGGEQADRLLSAASCTLVTASLGHQADTHLQHPTGDDYERRGRVPRMML